METKKNAMPWRRGADLPIRHDGARSGLRRAKAAHLLFSPFEERELVLVKVTPTSIPEVLLIEPQVFRDERGFFVESWNAREFTTKVDGVVKFVQDNHSRSGRGVLRGLHYQLPRAQGKLIRALSGRIFDVAVDMRKSSPTFGQWVGTELDGHEHRQLWVPVGFAHGYLVLSESADVLYKTTDYYAPEHEICVSWNDPAIGINWPIGGDPLLSAKDRAGLRLYEAPTFP